jgi:hypothetical protein
VAGHILECGAQASGGYSTDWRRYELADVGYPIAELQDDGRFVVTKPPGTGGAVNRRTVTEQLVYEIGDPAAYLTPDVVVDFTGVELAELAADRVAVRGTRGRAAPESYKVALAYHDGYMASGELLVYGLDCVEKARVAAAIVFDRLQRGGIVLAKENVELLGIGDGVPGLVAAVSGQREVVLRITVQDPDRESVRRFARELAPLITSGPAGLAGYAQGRPQVRPVYAHWPTTVPKQMVEPKVEVRTAEEWTKITTQSVSEGS